MIKKRGKIVFEIRGKRVAVDTTLSKGGAWSMQHEDIAVTERTRADCIKAFQEEIEKKAVKKKSKHQTV